MQFLPDAGEPNINGIDLVELLQKLMRKSEPVESSSGAGSTTDPGSCAGETRSRLSSDSLIELLCEQPCILAKDAKQAEQVVNALQRPSSESPSGFDLAPSTSQFQRLRNANILEWVLRPRQEFDSVWQLSQMEHGCRIIQQALEVVDASIAKEEPLRPLCEKQGRGLEDPKILLARGFKDKVNEAARHKYANYVLQKCIEVLPRQSTAFVLEEIQAVDAAKHQFGCRVLQRLIEHFWDVQEVPTGLIKIAHQLIKEDETNQRETNQRKSPKLRLVNDQYANFVFRSLLEHCAGNGPAGHSDLSHEVVTRVLLKDIHWLAKTKHASHLLSYILKSTCIEFRQHREDIANALTNGGDVQHDKFRELKQMNFGSFIYKQVEALLAPPQAVRGRKGVEMGQPAWGSGRTGCGGKGAARRRGSSTPIIYQ